MASWSCLLPPTLPPSNMRLPHAFVVRIGDINGDGDTGILDFAHLCVGILKAAGPCLA